MPTIHPKRSEKLGIELIGDRSHYAPGDVVIGRVFRARHIVSPSADVHITLCGHARSKIEENHGGVGGGGTVVYKDGFDLVDDRGRTQSLFSGPLHIPDKHNDGTAAGESWPFAVELPTHVDPACFERGRREQSVGYLPTSPEAVASHPLPGTFHSLSYSYDGYVQYWLKATLVFVNGNKRETVEALQPVVIDTVCPGTPDKDLGINRGVFHTRVLTPRLAPDVAEGGMSLSQRAQKLFHSSKVPTFAGDLELSHATVVQLESQTPLPLLARFIPDNHATSEVIRDFPQKIKVTSLTMSIYSETTVRCGFAESTDGSQKATVTLWPPLRGDGDKKPVAPLYVPCSGELPPLDIGGYVDLRLGRDGTAGMKRLYPTFTTYNIRHTHEIGFEIELEIAGERIKHKIKSTLNVIPPADDGLWIRPPNDEAGAPPTFADARRESPPA